MEQNSGNLSLAEPSLQESEAHEFEFESFSLIFEKEEWKLRLYDLREEEEIFFLLEDEVSEETQLFLKEEYKIDFSGEDFERIKIFLNSGA